MAIIDTPMTDRRPFDWHYSKIALNTVIDESYRNTQNVRRFFRSAIGDHFRFDRTFMAWVRSNTGKTMADAITEWKQRRG